MRRVEREQQSDTLQASRREDRALRGRNLSAHPEAGHAEEFDSSFSVPDMLGIKAKNPKLLGLGKPPVFCFRPIARLAASPKTMYAP